jgi:hypothetical protein
MYKFTKYQVYVAGEDNMEKYGLPFHDENRAIECAKRLSKDYIGSVMVEKITVELIYNN